MSEKSGRVTLILGGARSGKSRRALALAEGYGERIFIATAEALDEEMQARIARHRAEREASWETIEAPHDLVAALANTDRPGAIVVVDCLTLWLSNLLLAATDPQAETARLIRALSAVRTDVVLVSNEVGLGLVPETPLGRTFRDAQGKLNQQMAEVADRVEFVAAGLPLVLKG